MTDLSHRGAEAILAGERHPEHRQSSTLVPEVAWTQAYAAYLLVAIGGSIEQPFDAVQLAKRKALRVTTEQEVQQG